MEWINETSLIIGALAAWAIGATVLAGMAALKCDELRLEIMLNRVDIAFLRAKEPPKEKEGK